MLFSYFSIKFYVYKKFKLSIKNYLLLIYTFMCMIIVIRIVILSFQSHQNRILSTGLGMAWNRDGLSWKDAECSETEKYVFWWKICKICSFGRVLCIRLSRIFWYGYGKPQKKVLLSMAGPLRPNPPPAQWPLKFWNVGKKGSKKVLFFLNGVPSLESFYWCL